LDNHFKLKQVLEKKCVDALPKGEVWLGSRLFERADLKDTVENHILLAQRLDQDVVCLPVCDVPAEKPDLGYRYFTSGDLADVTDGSDLPVLAVIDGPFQEMVNKLGLMRVLTDWIRNPQTLYGVYEAEKKGAFGTIRHCLDLGVDGIVMADDFSSERGPLVNPADIDTMCRDFYARAVAAAHRAGVPLLLHCCGNLAQLVEIFKTWRIDGFAAIQSNLNNLTDLYEKMGANVTILAGIEGVMLETDRPPQQAVESLVQVVASLASTGNFVLGSSCGLYDGDFLDRIQRLYEIAQKG
jgi:hypothetical protein